MSPTACGLCPSGTGDITSLLGKTLAYDTAGRLSQATGVPPCPGGVNCSGLQTTTSRYNGWGQRLLRENDLEQSVFSYGLEGFNLLSQTTRRLATSQQSTTEHIGLPTASGPMPIAAVIDGTHHAVHADHLNTPRRLSDSAGQTRWQWPYSGFGEIAPQSTPAAGQAPVNYALRYPGQIDELFYNWHRFYDPRVGRYTKADPIGLDGGWNRFGYVDANPVSKIDPTGEFGVVGAAGGEAINGGGQLWALMKFGGATLEEAARCVDLNKVVISAGFGLVGPTFMNGFFRTAPWSFVAGTQISGFAVKATSPLRPCTPFGNSAECDCLRAKAKENMPHLVRNFWDNLGF